MQTRTVTTFGLLCVHQYALKNSNVISSIIQMTLFPHCFNALTMIQVSRCNNSCLVMCYFPPLPLTQVLICRNYKGDVDMAEIDHFMPLLVQHEEEGLLCPVLSHGNVHFMWIKHTNLYCILFGDI